MEATLTGELPVGPEWRYEPKWDGFRCLAFRDAGRVELMSKAGKPLTRYFPEVVARLRTLSPTRFVLDGELVIARDGAISFDDLLLRIHPAESRVRKLSAEIPADYILFDLLVSPTGRSLVKEPLAKRRAALERFVAKLGDTAGFLLSPMTTHLETVHEWLEAVGSGLDGIMAKRADLPYQSGNRHGMKKLKLMRTADCVVGGFRYTSKAKVVGSLLLGLHDDDGALQHVGFTANIPAKERKTLTAKLEKLEGKRGAGFTGRSPGGPSRWSTERTADWHPVAPTLVVEVRYDHFDGGRFRHGTAFLRWRPDKDPGQCSLAQVEREQRSALALPRLTDSPASR